MAGNNDIRQRIVLEGEQQYKQALKDAQRNLKTLRSELKAETAEMGRNATEAQKNEARLKNLKKQIEEQEKVVKTYREALEEVKKKYGDNEDAVAKWEQKLNDARTSLANMKNELDGVDQGFKGINTDAAAATVATKSVADSISNLASVGDSIASSLEGIFTGMVSRIKDAVTQVWAIIADTAAKANNWTDLAGIYNSSTGKIQQWYNAFGATGGEGKFNEFVSFTSKLAAGGESQWKKIAENFGISRENYEDDMQYAWDVLAAVYDYREKNGQKAYEAAMSRAGLGKKGESVGWMISNWAGLSQNMQSFEESGYNMGEDAIDVFNNIELKIFEIDQKWDALKSKIVEPFAPIVLAIQANVTGVMDGISEYLAADTEGEKQAALAKIRTNIEDLFTKVAELIRECIHILTDVGTELQGSEDPMTAAIGDVMVSLAGALQWMVDNADAVKTAFKTIFGTWLIAKLAAVGGKIASIVTNIKTIQAFSAVGSGTSVASTGGTIATSIGAKVTGLSAAVKGFLTAGGGASMLAPLGVLAAGILPSVLANNWDIGNINARQSERLANASNMGYSGWWLESMANALGLNGTGMQSDYASQEALLKGLGTRGVVEKGQLLSALGGRYSGGNNAAAELMDYWATGGEGWDPWRVTQLAETVADAYPAIASMSQVTESLPDAGWWTNQTNTNDALREASERTNSVLSSLPDDVAKAMSGVKVVMDKEEVGRLVAPVVNQQMASQVAY